jgi:hypothetical protein
MLAGLLMVLVVCYLAAVGAQCLNSWIDSTPPDQRQAQLLRMHLVVDAQP